MRSVGWALTLADHRSWIVVCLFVLFLCCASLFRATKRWHAEEEVVDDITAVVVYF